jgi:hypothetical protein
MLDSHSEDTQYPKNLHLCSIGCEMLRFVKGGVND